MDTTSTPEKIDIDDKYYIVRNPDNAYKWNLVEKETGQVIDQDRYRHDLLERHGLRVNKG